jgi:uncharacterized cupin superfamily protein
VLAVAPPQYVVHRATEIEYQPLLIDDEQVGEAHQLRAEGSRGNEHEAASGEPTPLRAPTTCSTGDESFYVLQGSVSIELPETGERIDLKAGDAASFAKGTRSVWTFSEPFKKFTVISS